MCNFLKVLENLEQQNLVVACDEGVYHIAKHIQLIYSDKFKNLFIMLGDFHLLKAGLACVGKYLRDSGIEHLLIESRIFGSNVVEQVFLGSNYSRSIKGFFLIAEVLERLLLEQFILDHPEEFEYEMSLIQALKSTFEEGDFNACKNLLNDFKNCSENLINELHNYIERNKKTSQTYFYYYNVILMIRTLRDFLRADRSGDFFLHIDSVKKLLPLFLIMDRTHYTRWCTIYLNDILGLEKNYPEIYKEFVSGKFAIKFSDIPFSSSALDQRLEQTVNKSKKS